ncbi:PfkB family carbohydrate kinase [bacterium]|jgi:sugar/nucleoside kinase (ribokinase family)|nr:PfkB family carbohydrate kinase [bacterium]
MSVMVVGSIALDSIKTPFGNRKSALGGSATYFSYSANFFTDVMVVGVVGQDFPQKHLDFLKKAGVDIRGIEVAEGLTFRWEGEYEFDMNVAKTNATYLNVFEKFSPKIPADYTRCDTLFLANIDPELQHFVLKNISPSFMTACDTMNLWIELKRSSLLKLLKKINILIINDAEARQFTQQASIIKAGNIIREWGPEICVIKKGEHGALLFSKDGIFAAPSYPLEAVIDPTGAGDTFAGGFIGYLDRIKKLDNVSLKQAMICGSVLASFNVEGFSFDKLKQITKKDILSRYGDFKRISHFDDPGLEL